MSDLATLASQLLSTLGVPANDVLTLKEEVAYGVTRAVTNPEVKVSEAEAQTFVHAAKVAMRKQQGATASLTSSSAGSGGAAGSSASASAAAAGAAAAAAAAVAAAHGQSDSESDSESEEETPFSGPTPVELEVTNLAALKSSDPESLTAYSNLAVAITALNRTLFRPKVVNGQPEPVELSDDQLKDLTLKIRAVHDGLANALLHAPKDLDNVKMYVDAILKMFETAEDANKDLDIFLRHVNNSAVRQRLNTDDIRYTGAVATFPLTSETWPVDATELYEYISKLLQARFLGSDSSSPDAATRKRSIEAAVNKIVTEISATQTSPEERRYREVRSILSVLQVTLELAQAEQATWTNWLAGTGAPIVEVQRHTLKELLDVIHDQIGQMTDGPTKEEATQWYTAASKSPSGTAPAGDLDAAVYH